MNEVQELAEIERRIERIARAICRADGNDPDQMVMLYSRHKLGAKGHIVMEGLGAKTVCSWMLYYSEAQAAVEALAEVTA